MKVLFTANIPSPYRTAFFNELGKLCDLTVLYERDRDVSRDRSWTGEDPENYRAVIMKGFDYSEADAFCPEVDRYLKQDYDIFVIALYSSLTGMYAIRRLYSRGRKFVMSTDGGIPGSGRGFKEGVKRYFISKASAWLSTGELCDRYLTTYGADRDRIFRYPFSSVKDRDVLKAVPSPEEKAEARRILGITEEKVVLSVGQFIYRKGFDILEEAAPMVERAYPETAGRIGYYVVGGDGQDGPYLHRRAFAGKERLKLYYRAADIFVLPTREDIWGLVVNEAMASGLPVITTDRCGSGLELINGGSGDAGPGTEEEKHRNGLIVPAGDAEALASAIGKAIAGEIVLSPEEALKTAGRYTLENMAKTHMEIFESDTLQDLIKIKQS